MNMFTSTITVDRIGRQRQRAGVGPHERRHHRIGESQHPGRQVQGGRHRTAGGDPLSGRARYRSRSPP